MKLVRGQFIESPDGDSHIMGSTEPGRYLDLMHCCRGDYVDTRRDNLSIDSGE